MQHECCRSARNLKNCKLYSIAFILWKSEIKKMPPTATFGCPLNFSFCESQKYPDKRTCLKKEKKKNPKLNVGKYGSFFKKSNDIHDTFPTDLNRKMNFISMFNFFLVSLYSQKADAELPLTASLYLCSICTM